MNEWVREWVGEWVNERVSEWISEWVSEWMSGWESEWVGEWVSGWVSEWVNKYWYNESQFFLTQTGVSKLRCHRTSYTDWSEQPPYPRRRVILREPITQARSNLFFLSPGKVTTTATPERNGELRQKKHNCTLDFFCSIIQNKLRTEKGCFKFKYSFCHALQSAAGGSNITCHRPPTPELSKCHELKSTPRDIRKWKTASEISV